VLAADPGRGDVRVLPYQPYRRFAWNRQRPQLDPAPRWLPRGAIIDDTLRVDGIVIKGESARGNRLRAAIAGRTSLAAQGIGWVLVEHGTPGEVEAGLVRELEPVYSGRWLALYRVREKIAEPPVEAPPAAAVLTADLVAAGLLAAALITVAFAPLRRRLPIGKFK
jgi:hypothetical protein